MKNLFERYFKKSLLMEDDSFMKAMSVGLDNEEPSDPENKKLKKSAEREIDASKNELSQAEKANEILKGDIEAKIKEGNDQIAIWAKALEDFATFVNDPTDEESIKHAIDNANDGSVLAAVKDKKEQMIKVATDCVILAQSLRGIIGTVSSSD